MIVAQLTNEFLAFMEPKSVLSYSQEPTSSESLCNIL